MDPRDLPAPLDRYRNLQSISDQSIFSPVSLVPPESLEHPAAPVLLERTERRDHRDWLVVLDLLVLLADPADLVLLCPEERMASLVPLVDPVCPVFPDPRDCLDPLETMEETVPLDSQDPPDLPDPSELLENPETRYGSVLISPFQWYGVQGSDGAAGRRGGCDHCPPARLAPGY